MSALALFLAATLSATGLSSLSGQVLDAQQRPLAGAQVFLEQGITGPVQRTETNSQGEYQFSDLIPGLTGVIAVADGLAFNGHSVQLAPEDHPVVPPIMLNRAGSVSGTIKDTKNAPVSGAVITRMLLMESRVSVPFAKLRAFGFPPPQSDRKGRFQVSDVPGDASIALKFAHPSYAQEAVMGITAGQSDVAIRLEPGILVTGKVLARGTEVPVSNATIKFDNIRPPKDTALTRSGGDGSYGVRLKPGEYVYEAVGNSYRSPVKMKLSVTGDYPGLDVPLYVAGNGLFTGRVMDAVSGEPIPGARILLEVSGTPSALSRSGSTGTYSLSGIVGENVVRFLSAPGYLPPANPVLTLQLSPREEVSVPTFWLLPTPKYSLEVIDGQKQPVEGAIVTVLQPQQWGWRTTDADGLVELAFAQLPSDGRVFGMIEHPRLDEGALFSISRDRSEDAIVQLQSFTSVSGKVTDGAGKTLRGVTVSAYYGDDQMNTPVLVRQATSGREGAFTMAGVPTGVSLVFSTDGTNPPVAHRAESSSTISEALMASTDQARPSTLGKSFPWREFSHEGGVQLPRSGPKDAPAIAIHAAPGNEAATLESLETMAAILNRPSWHYVLISEATTELDSASVSIVQGSRPASSNIYVMDSAGLVIYESNFFPPLMLLHGLD